MNTIRKIAFACMAMSVLHACGGGNEENTQKTKVEFTVSPTAAKNEAAFGHDIVFTVQSGKDVNAELSDAGWASASVSSGGADDTYTVTVTLETNEEQASRSTKLTVTAGSDSRSIDISQQGFGSLLSSGIEINLDGTSEQVITLKLPYDWQISISDTKSADWLEVSPASGLSGFSTEVSFRALTLNTDYAVRIAYARISLKNGSFALTVRQASSLPSEDFLQSPAYGLYNYDGAGSAITYDELAHQTVAVEGNANSFRIVWPSKDKFLEFSEIPSKVEVGDVFTLGMRQFWVTSLDTESSSDITIVARSAGTVYAIDSDKKGYVFPVPEAQ